MTATAREVYQRHRLTVRDYQRMGEAGIFHEDERIELIEGEIVDDVLLIIEVADSSLAYDRDIKLPLYAQHGIPEVWLVDLTGRQLTIHQQPTAAAYRQAFVPRALSGLALPMTPTVTVNLEGLF